MKLYHIYWSNEEQWFTANGRYFIARPTTAAHRHAMGIPHGYRYAVYLSGGDPSGCAKQLGVYRTKKEAIQRVASEKEGG